MSDMLSQAEIDALLSGSPLPDAGDGSADSDSELTPQEKDALGEIGNISMGTSATTLFNLLGQKVTITTPKVSITTWEELSKEYTYPIVAVKVEYTKGLLGTNLLILKEDDVKIITDLMMGGDGKVSGGELTDLHLSAISEAMNQMIGSSATSMSSMFSKRIDISPPKAFVLRFEDTQPFDGFETSQKIARVAFKMVVGNLIDSEIMQLIPLKFAKSLVENLLSTSIESPYIDVNSVQKKQETESKPAEQPMFAQPPVYQQEPPRQDNLFHNRSEDEIYEDDSWQRHRSYHDQKGPVNVQPAQFQSFEDEKVIIEKKNISMIMDVPLQVTVELGRTHKLIKDILEFGPGSIIELDKLAGEPVDILVNGKPIAKGEVVVIDESFGVRITDIIHPSKRL